MRKFALIAPFGPTIAAIAAFVPINAPASAQLDPFSQCIADCITNYQQYPAEYEVCRQSCYDSQGSPTQTGPKQHGGPCDLGPCKPVMP